MEELKPLLSCHMLLFMSQLFIVCCASVMWALERQLHVSAVRLPVHNWEVTVWMLARLRSWPAHNRKLFYTPSKQVNCWWVVSECGVSPGRWNGAPLQTQAASVVWTLVTDLVSMPAWLVSEAAPLARMCPQSRDPAPVTSLTRLAKNIWDARMCRCQCSWHDWILSPLCPTLGSN